MKKLLLALALTFLPSLAWAQCTGVFAPNTLCGNLTGSPAPPSAFSASGTVAGPGSSTVNDIAVWNNTSGTLLKDVPFLTICGSNIFSSSLVGCVPASGGGVTSFLRADSTFAVPPTFGSGAPGYVPASGGGTTNFLRADGTFSAPTSTTSGSLYAPSQANVSASALNTTGTISAASSTLTLAAATDFINGQGIRVNHAGAANGLGAPSSLTVTPTGTSGSTTYTYTIAPFNASGGYGPAITNVVTTTGNATLSITNYNAVSWAAASGAVGYAVYGRIGGSLALLAFVAGTTFNDLGTLNFASQSAPDWMPGTPPGSGAANWLITSISSGGGTTTLTLAATATTTATTQGVYHDDTVALQAALSSAISNNQRLNLGNGIYRISSAITGTGPLQIYGNGPTVGLSPGSIVLTSPTQHGLNLSGNYIVLHDFSFQGGSASSSGQVSGALMNFNGSGAVWIDRITSQYGSNCIGGPTGAGPYYITNNLLSGYGNMINIFSIGDSFITGNSFSPISLPGSTSSSAINLTGDPGGAKIINNKANAGGYGYAVGVNVALSISDGDILITGNSIEQANAAAILIDRTSTPSFSNFLITGNQLVSSGRGIYFPSASAWASIIAITGNVINATTADIDLANVAELAIQGNVLAGGGTGINIGASTTHCMISPNVFLSSLAVQISDASAACTYGSITTTKPTYP